MKQLIDASKADDRARQKLVRQTATLRRGVQQQLARIAGAERRRNEKLRQHAAEEARQEAERQKAEADAEAAAKAAAKAVAVAADEAKKHADEKGAKMIQERMGRRAGQAQQRAVGVGVAQGGRSAGGGVAGLDGSEAEGGQPTQRRGRGGMNGHNAVAVLGASAAAASGDEGGGAASANGKPHVAGGEGAQTLEEWKASLKRMLRRGRQWRPPGVHSTC